MKKKITTAAISAFMILSLISVIAIQTPLVSANPEDPIAVKLEITGAGSANWTTELKHSGDYSVHLTAGASGGNEARIVIPMPEGTTLGDIETISWWIYTVAGYPAHVDITLDVDNDGYLDDVDMLTAEMAYNNSSGNELDNGLEPTLGSWLKTFELTLDDGYGQIDNDTMLWVTKMGAGNDDAPWGTLRDWKDGIVANDPEPDLLAAGVIDASAPVLRLEIEVDDWVLSTEVYVDDITINGETYDLEPRVINENTGAGYDTIQDAIDNASPNDTINVAAGTYNEVVTIDKSLTLLGAKAGEDARTRDTSSGESILDGSSLIVGDRNAAFKIADGVNGVTIDGFEIHSYPREELMGGYGSAIFVYFDDYWPGSTGTSGITVQNNYMHDLGWNAIVVGNIYGFTQSSWLVQRNLIENAPYAGIELTNVIDSEVLNNKIIAPTSIVDDPGDAGVGIEIAVRAQAGQTIIAGTNVLVENNEIIGAFPQGPTTGISRAGINLLSRTYAVNADATLSGVTVRGNIVSGGGANLRAGILAVAESRYNGPATITNLLIEYNVLDGNHDGIVVEQVGGGTHDSLAILGNDITDFTKGGIVVEDVLSVQIEGNVISTTDHSVAPNGIQVGYIMDPTATTGTVNNNIVSGCHWSGYDPLTETYEDDWTGSGILVIAPNSALTISGNEVQNSDVGLDIEAGSGTLITNNDVHNNSYGFVLWNANPTINYNNIYQNGLCGVYRTTGGSLVGTLDATLNWWGDPSGPSGVGLGSGDAVSANVDYRPWLRMPVGEDETPPTIENALAIPDMISLITSTDGMSTGPEYTYLVVETYGFGTNVTLNLRPLLEQMFANVEFEDEERWQELLEDMEDIPMDVWSDNIWYFGGFEEFDGFYTWMPIWALLEFDLIEEEEISRILSQEIQLGDFTIPVTFSGYYHVYDEFGNPVTEYTELHDSIELAIVDLMVPLEEGWNLRSTPVALANPRWGDITSLGLGDSLSYDAALRIDVETGEWVIVDEDYELKPLEAIYIHATERDQIGLIFSRELTAPPMRQLGDGWNLVGYAPSSYCYWYYGYWYVYAYFDWDSMRVHEALVPIQETPEGLGGYTAVVSPGEYWWYDEEYEYKEYWFDSYEWYFEQDAWAYTARPWDADGYRPWMEPFGGYWVFMENPDLLAGFSNTPVQWYWD